MIDPLEIDPFDEQAEQVLFPHLSEDFELQEAQFSSEYDENDEYEDDGQPTEQQENEDFAQDDDWHNQSASDMI